MGLSSPSSVGSSAYEEAAILGRFLVGLTWTLHAFSYWITTRFLFPAATDVLTQSARSYDSIESYTGLCGFFRGDVCLTPFGRHYLLLYRGVLLLSLCCHARSVFGDPGFLSGERELRSRPPPEGIPHPRLCKICKLKWKPPRAHHCRKCKQCVFRMDHHCSWVNNCVGFRNQKFFVLFLIYALLLSVVQLSVVLMAMVPTLWQRRRADGLFSRSFLISSGLRDKNMLAGGIMLTMVGMTVWIVWEFLGEQIEALRSNQTLVESHQLTRGASRSFWECLRDVFGTNYHAWLLPMTPRQTLHLEEPVFLVDEVADHLRSKQHLSADERRSKAASGAVGSRLEDDEFANIYILPNQDIGVDVSEDSGEYVALESHFEGKPQHPSPPASVYAGGGSSGDSEEEDYAVASSAMTAASTVRLRTAK